MQAPFDSPLSVQPGPVVSRTSQPQRTGPCRPYNVPQQLLRSSRLKVENQDEGGGGPWRRRKRLPACGNTRLPIASAAARPLSDRGGGESSFPHQGTPCQRTALSHTRVPLASAQSFPHQGTPCQRSTRAPSSRRRSLRRAILPTVLATARHPPDGARYGAAPAYSARYGAPSAYSAHYSAERSAPSTSASSAMRTYMPFSISIK